MSKGVLPSLWAFYFLRIPVDSNILEKYTELYKESTILYFMLYYCIVYIFFYFILDFGIRYFLVRRVGFRIYKYYSSIQKNRTVKNLRELNELKSSFLKGMGVTIELGYLSKKSILETPEIAPISKEEKEQALYEFGNLVCSWATVTIHLLVTLIFVFSMNWIILSVILILGLILLVLIYSAIALVISNLNSASKIKESIKRD